MSETSPRGRFVWYDLLTTDPGGAADFYTKVAGWGTQDWPGSGATPYTMWTTHDTPLGGVMQLTPDMEGVPPHWIGYVAVPNVDESAKQSEALGGKVLTAANGHSGSRPVRGDLRSAGRGDRDLHAEGRAATAGARA